MNVRRIAYLGGGTIAVASWLSSASTPVAPPPAVAPTPLPVAIQRSSAALQAEVSRLHDRLTPTATPAQARDLFRFSTRKARHSSEQPDIVPPPVPPAEPAPPPAPVFQLIGIAEDMATDGLVRTAIVAGLGDVFLVKAGDVFAGQYRVDHVSTDVVQFTDTTTSAASTLALR